MDEAYLPWWLVLLIGMWAAAITVWQHPAVNREVRLWAWLLTLVYLALFFVALGRVPGLEAGPSDHQQPASLLHLGLAICVVLSLIFSVSFVGRVTGSQRRLSYVMVSVSNSAAAFVLQCQELGVGLLLVACLAAWPAIRRWWQAKSVFVRRDWMHGYLQFSEDAVPRDQSGIVWLAGSLTAVLVCLLLGTMAYSARFETSRTVANTRSSALPPRSLLEPPPETSGNKADVINSLLETRSEVFVLLAVIVFLCLAMTSGDDVDRQSLTSAIDDASQLQAGAEPMGSGPA